MLRILFASDAPWSTSGYAVETALTTPRLTLLGHEVALMCTFGLQGATRTWTSDVLGTDGKPITLKVYPGGADAFGNDVIGHAAQDWKADIVITLKDSFVFRPDAFQGLRWCGMVPVDHEPIPPPATQVVHAMYRPIAYAPNGFRELRKAGFDPLFCPHGYDPKVYYPVEKADARKFLGLPDDLFFVGTVAVNRGGIPSRKAWPQNLEAFALFAKDKPEARYFLHTDLAADGFENGVNLGPLVNQLGIGDKVFYCDQTIYRRGGFPLEYMRAYYNAIDVLNAVSLGEGFGIPALEAQACGCPVILSNFAAHRDLCFGGWHVSDGLKFYDAQATWTFIPQPEAVAAALNQAHAAAHDRPAFAKDARAKAIAGARDYQIDRVVQEHWKPALEELEQQIAADADGRGVLRIVRPEEVGVKVAA